MTCDVVAVDNVNYPAKFEVPYILVIDPLSQSHAKLYLIVITNCCSFGYSTLSGKTWILKAYLLQVCATVSSLCHDTFIEENKIWFLNGVCRVPEGGRGGRKKIGFLCVWFGGHWLEPVKLKNQPIPITSQAVCLLFWSLSQIH